jgi:hypothetical protein
MGRLRDIVASQPRRATSLATAQHQPASALPLRVAPQGGVARNHVKWAWAQVVDLSDSERELVGLVLAVGRHFRAPDEELDLMLEIAQLDPDAARESLQATVSRFKVPTASKNWR